MQFTVSLRSRGSQYFLQNECKLPRGSYSLSSSSSSKLEIWFCLSMVDVQRPSSVSTTISCNTYQQSATLWLLTTVNTDQRRARRLWKRGKLFLDLDRPWLEWESGVTRGWVIFPGPPLRPVVRAGLLRTTIYGSQTIANKWETRKRDVGSEKTKSGKLSPGCRPPQWRPPQRGLEWRPSHALVRTFP